MISLTQEQLDYFAQKNQRLGLAPNAHEEHQLLFNNALVKKSSLVLSSDPLESDVPPIFVGVGSIADFKKLVGRADDATTPPYEITYPAGLSPVAARLLETAKSKIAFMQQMEPDFMDDLQVAANAFVMGDSQKVKEYEPVINALMFPGRIAVFTGVELRVPDNQTFHIKGPDPVFINFQRILLGENTEVIITTAAMVNSLCVENA